MRSPSAITFAVWRAIFLREALDRLFGARFAWAWLLLEPVFHIAFIGLVWWAIRTHTHLTGQDMSVWVMVGLLAFFIFRRTAVQVMYAVDSNQPYFAYRQVKPFDTAIVRGILEMFLMAIVSLIILIAAGLMGHEVIPVDPLLAISAVAGLWLIGLGLGMVASVFMVLVPESKHVFMIMMLPLYLLSGVIFPISAVPPPFRDMLLLNPLVHGVEVVREGFFANYYVLPAISLAYLYAWAVGIVFLGLVLYRRFALRLVTQ